MANPKPDVGPAPLPPPTPAGRYWPLPPASSARWFAAGGAVLVLAGVLLGVAVAGNAAWFGDRELGVNSWFRDVGNAVPLLGDLAGVVSWVGAGHTNRWVVPVVVVALVVARRWVWAVFLVAVSQGGVAISSGIKHQVGRPRPPWEQFSASQEGTSFPSGHTFAGITVWVALGLVAVFVLRRPAATVVGGVALAIGLAQGPSRLLLAQHWGTDVVGGLVLGVGWLGLCWAVLVWVAGPGPPPPESHPGGL